MKQRVITGALLLLVLIPTLYFGGIYFTIIGILFSIIAAHEVLRLFKVKFPLIAVICIYTLFAFAPIVLTIISTDYLLLMLFTMLLLLMIFLVWYEQFTLENIGVIYFVFTLIQILISAIASIQKQEIQLLMMIVICTYVTDAFCLFGGKAFGKHKLNVRISPNKTIEGAISGWVVGAGLGLLYGLLRVSSISKLNIILLCVLIPIIAQIGDLTFSAIKRHYKIKDFGNIFPGHGGVLDRIDSLALVSVLYFIIQSLF